MSKSVTRMLKFTEAPLPPTTLEELFAVDAGGTTLEALDSLRQRATELLERAAGMVLERAEIARKDAEPSVREIPELLADTDPEVLARQERERQSWRASRLELAATITKDVTPEALRRAQDAIATAATPEALQAAIKPQMLAAFRASLGINSPLSEALEILVPPYPADMATVNKLVSRSHLDQVAEMIAAHKHSNNMREQEAYIVDVWPKELRVRLAGGSPGVPILRVTHEAKVAQAVGMIAYRVERNVTLAVRFDPETLLVEQATAATLDMVCRAAQPDVLALFPDLSEGVKATLRPDTVPATQEGEVNGKAPKM